ncbi:MAG: hypothetical protein ABFD82_18375 [Syntrophaceae bacterium]
MTEKEAKTKICPKYKAAFIANTGSQILCEWPSDILKITACIASACMMWRWEYEMKLPEGYIAAIPVQTDKGYCGLGGKP